MVFSFVLGLNTFFFPQMPSSVADPDPYVFGHPGSGSAIQSYGIRILPSSSKKSKKNLDSYCFVTSLWNFIFEKWCKCIIKKAKSRKTYGSADPDSYQNVTDQQHWWPELGFINRTQTAYWKVYRKQCLDPGLHWFFRKIRICIGNSDPKPAAVKLPNMIFFMIPNFSKLLLNLPRT